MRIKLKLLHSHYCLAEKINKVANATYKFSFCQYEKRFPCLPVMLNELEFKLQK